VMNQVHEATEKKGAGKLDDLFDDGETWVVE